MSIVRPFSSLPRSDSIASRADSLSDISTNPKPFARPRLSLITFVETTFPNGVNSERRSASVVSCARFPIYSVLSAAALPFCARRLCTSISVPHYAHSGNLHHYSTCPLGLRGAAAVTRSARTPLGASKEERFPSGHPAAPSSRSLGRRVALPLLSPFRRICRASIGEARPIYAARDGASKTIGAVWASYNRCHTSGGDNLRRSRDRA